MNEKLKRLTKSREILKDIKLRKIFKYVGEILILPDFKLPEEVKK